MIKHRLSKLTVMSLLAVALVAYVVLSPLIAWPLYSAILFRPDKRTKDVASELKLLESKFNLRTQEISFRSANGSLLRGWFFELPNTKRVFLVSEGKGGNIYKKLNIAYFLLGCGGSVLMYDYQGYGQSEGTPTLDGVCEDVVAAYDYLKDHEHRNPDDIIAFGESFGTGVSGQLVLRRKLAGVILHSGFASLISAGQDTLPWLRLYPDNCFPKQMLDNNAVFRKTHPPLLIVHGKMDRLLSCKRVERLYEGSIEPKMMLLLPDGEHCTFGKGREFHSTVTEFLQRNKI